MSSKHAIVTACDAKCGDFLAFHWLPSLRDNVRLDDVDVVVLDYGLTPEQRDVVDFQGAIRRSCSRDGFVNNLRFRDLAQLVSEVSYDQVMLVDSGDVIFQADIRDIFDRDPGCFRAVCEELYTAQYEHFISTSDFRKGDYKYLVDSVRGTKIINTGMLLGPARKFAALWPAMKGIVQDVQNWGTLQLVINHLFYKEGFVELPYRYNFIIMTAKSPYRILDGKFYDEHGDLIPIVHNAGGKEALRLIRHFGYGPDRNHPKVFSARFVKLFLQGVNWWKRGAGRTPPKPRRQQRPAPSRLQSSATFSK